MNLPGGRYDLEAMRERALAKKAAEKRKKIIGVAVNIILLAVLLGSGWYGWNRWQEHKEEEREMEKLRVAEEARRAREREEREAKRREDERKQREKERREREERDAARKKAIEDERIRLAEEKIRLEEEKLRQQEKERAEREWQEKYKSFADNAVKDLKFDTKDYVMCQAGCEDIVECSVAGERWESLSSMAKTGMTVDFLRALNKDGAVTNEFSETHYPDHATVRSILKFIENERFTMVFREVPPKPDDKKRNREFILLSADLNEGLALPKGGRELTGPDGKVTGFTAPFLYGRTPTFYIMRKATAARLVRDWRKTKKKIEKSTEQLEQNANKDVYIRSRLREEIGDFLAAVRVEMATPEPDPPPPPPPNAKKKPKQPKSGIKGMTDMKTFK